MSNRSGQNVDVEEVVRQVLARLAVGAAPVAEGSCGCQHNVAAAAHSHGPCQCPGKTDNSDKSGNSENNAAALRPAEGPPATALPAQTLAWSDRVLTVRDLKGRLAGLKRVAVAPRTIVTPAVIDFLREAGVELVRGGSVGAQTPAANAAALIVATAGTDFCTDALRAHLSQRGIETIRAARGSLVAATQATIEQVTSRRRPALLVASQPLVAACLANRQRAIRAAVVRTVDETRQALVEIGANVIVIDPSRCPAAEQQRIARELAMAASNCPAELVAALA